MKAKKEYLDLAGLKIYDERIKEIIEAGDSNLESQLKVLANALVGETIRAQGAEGKIIELIEDSYVSKTDFEWGALGESEGE